MFMTFNKLAQLISENIETNDPHILIVEDNPGLQSLMRQSFKKEIPEENIKILDNATDAIVFIGNNMAKITHYSLDYDLSYGEKGTQVAEFLSQQGNSGQNVWIHSGNVDNREEFLAYLPDAHITPSPANIPAIIRSL